MTAVVLFVPVSAWGTYEVIAAADPGWGYQVLAIGIAVGLHAALIALVVSRLVRLRRTTPAVV